MRDDDDTNLLEESRDALELTAEENADLCTGCTRCCETVSIEIDVPRSPWEYDQWIWVLHHQNLEVYVERPEKWFLHIEARCTQLSESGRCRIYGRHPVLCRQYDPRGCERRSPLSDVVAWFHDADELETWIERKRPGHYRRLLAYRAERAQAPSSGPRTLAEALVTITAPGGTGPAKAAHEPRVERPRRRPRPE